MIHKAYRHVGTDKWEGKCGIVVRFQKAVFLCSVMNIYLLHTSEHCIVMESVPVVVLGTLLTQIKL